MTGDLNNQLFLQTSKLTKALEAEEFLRPCAKRKQAAILPAQSRGRRWLAI
jgi:hypothetical protein